jgi:hypothetical protein
MTRRADTRTARAAPTKRLLVDVLTKDIDLIAAILDLIDNSVDGARRLRGGRPLKGLSIEVTFQKQTFEIVDNCGGISLEEAETRAFCFGPDDDDPPDPYSTGQFGVGMKRALFKMGRAFTVESTSQHDAFTMDVDIAQWLKADPWTFTLENVRTGLKTPPAKRGTTIEVKRLHPVISKELARSTFVNDLKTQTTKRHQRSLARGLAITIDGDPLVADDPKVIADKQLSPAVSKVSVNGKGEAVQVQIVCGVIDGKPRDAGWSVFLNDRAVLLADKSDATGWGEQDEGRIPRFHNQYGRFRGYAFLTCEDTTRLPWNTTKTGLDRDDPVYRAVRAMMVDVADPVVDFLDAVKKEKGTGNDDFGALRESIENGRPRSVFKLADGPEKSWTAPEAIPPPEAPDTVRIYTDQPVELVDEVKDVLDVTTNIAAGDAIFEYFVEREL